MRKYFQIIKAGIIILKSIAGIVCIGFIIYLMIFLGVFGNIPTYKELKKISYASGSEIYSKDSVLLGTYSKIDRANLKIQDISTTTIKALIATEDTRFYHHYGIDFKSALRVIFKSIISGDESAGGGSTLSQQLAKNLFPRKEFTFFSLPLNKVREMIISKRLEKLYSKNEILELYLNVVPMSGNIYGLQRASKRFFNKDAKDLKIEEAAVLIGMLKATTTYNPKRDLDKAKERRNTVLLQMNKYGYISKHMKDSLSAKKIELNLNNNDLRKKGIAPYLTEYLRPQLENWCNNTFNSEGESYDLYNDGLKIYTTLDSKLQLSANEAFNSELTKLQAIFTNHLKIDNYKSLMDYGMKNSQRYKKLKDDGLKDQDIRDNFKKAVETEMYFNNKKVFTKISPLDSVKYYQKLLQAGLIAIQPLTGEVKAWVGGLNFDAIQYDHVTSKRQAGSTFKPILYASAIENGMEPCQFFDNQLESYASYNNWTPKNADGKYGGLYSMKGALTNSVNTVSAKIMMQTGVQNVINTAKKMLITSKLPPYPSLALGVASVSLFDMVKAYSSFVNSGTPVEPIFINSIYNNKGNLIRTNDQQPFHDSALKERTASLMIGMLSNVVQEGTAKRLRSQYNLDIDIAGKTGTSQLQRDGWFIGITPELITGVWVGAESQNVHFSHLREGQGSATALPIFAEFLKNALVKRKVVLKKHFDILKAYWKDELNCADFMEEIPFIEADTLNNYYVNTDYEDDYQETYDEVVKQSNLNAISIDTTQKKAKLSNISVKSNSVNTKSIESKNKIEPLNPKTTIKTKPKVDQNTEHIPNPSIDNNK